MSERVVEKAFTVNAGIDAVAAFHNDPRTLRRLTPPPILVQFHRLDPMAEDAVVEFTMWFTFIPVRWTALHKDFDLKRGFTDIQVSGPLASWEHRHTFEPISPQSTLVKDSVTYRHATGWRGWLTRLVFGKLGLSLLFTYRKWVTRVLLEKEIKEQDTLAKK